jgi:hypothetical protein
MEETQLIFCTGALKTEEPSRNYEIVHMSNKFSTLPFKFVIIPCKILRRYMLRKMVLIHPYNHK